MEEGDKLTLVVRRERERERGGGREGGRENYIKIERKRECKGDRERR